MTVSLWTLWQQMFVRAEYCETAIANDMLLNFLFVRVTSLKSVQKSPFC